MALVLLPVAVFTQICHRLNPSLFKRCINVGYNYTARFPENFTLHEHIIGYHLERDARQFKQCSEHLDVIMCSIFVPKCIENHYSPVLPCRRICEQFVRDCEPRADYEKIEWIKGLCQLLPSRRKNRATQTCLEPANYKPAAVNSTSKYTDIKFKSCQPIDCFLVKENC